MLPSILNDVQLPDLWVLWPKIYLSWLQVSHKQLRIHNSWTCKIIAQFWYIKNQPETRHHNGATCTRFVGFIQGNLLMSFVLGWIWIYRNQALNRQLLIPQLCLRKAEQMFPVNLVTVLNTSQYICMSHVLTLGQI